MIEASDLPYGEKVYLKKDSIGWRTVEPWKIDGKINWFNLIIGGKRNLMFLSIILVIVFLLYLGIQELVSSYQTIAESPCDYCTDCQEQTRKVIGQMNADGVPNINISEVFKEATEG